MFGIPWAGAIALLCGVATPQSTTDAACVSCHPTVAAEWSASQHRTAFTESTFQTAHSLEPRAFCRACHAPEQNPSTRELTPASALGVSCRSCHLIDGEIVSGEGTVSADAPHSVRRDPDFGGLGCARCHQFDFPDSGLRAAPLAMQSTVDEHAASRHRGRSCAECHMPAGAAGRASHSFAVTRDPEALRRSVRVRARRVDEGQVVLTLVAGEVGHAVPTGDLLRRLEVGAAPARRPEMATRRYLARHFGQVRQPTGIALLDEIYDDRVPADGQPREVSLKLEAGRDETIVWWVRYQRVAHHRSLDPERALVDGEIELASGRLLPL